MPPDPREVVIFGATGGIGAALTRLYADLPDVERVHAIGRRPGFFHSDKIQEHRADITQERDITRLTWAFSKPDLVIVASGVLSIGPGLQPEKSLKNLSADAFRRLFAVNTIGPALVAKHLIPLMPRDQRAVFAALSARVGSISDNRLGGWHAYRASKAALNMLMRNFAIEQARVSAEFISAGLHPGTVRTSLSEPYRANVPKDQLFTPEHAAACLAGVIAGLTPAESGKVFDWAGKEVHP
jgi:NAD(P)-dependent dehydrogenase (short-subunit alcohol dehydrogenase family)